MTGISILRKRMMLLLLAALLIAVPASAGVHAQEPELTNLQEQNEEAVLESEEQADASDEGDNQEPDTPEGEDTGTDDTDEEQEPVTVIAADHMVLSYTSCTYTGNARHPKVTVYDKDGNVISRSNYKVTYSADCISVGIHYVKVTCNGEKYSGTFKKKFKISPMRPQITEVSSTKNNLRAVWTKIGKECSGYQLQYSKTKTFDDGTRKTVKITNVSKPKVNLTDFPVKEKYYIRVRSYKTVGSRTYYSKWSRKKALRIRQRDMNLNGKSAIIMDAKTGEVFYMKNADQPRAQASTTKMMTAILAIEKKSLDSKVKITKEAANTPYSNLGSAAIGKKIVMKDLLHMTLLPSDNGAATALAIHVSGSVSKFAKLMNAKAKKLGLTNSHFKNPHGLDTNGHYSSARDLAVLGAYCMKNKTFASIVCKHSYSFRTTDGKLYYNCYSNNALLGVIDGVVGVKSGTETNAGYCFVCAYKHNGHMYMTVILGSDSVNHRWSDIRSEINYINTYL